LYRDSWINVLRPPLRLRHVSINQTSSTFALISWRPRISQVMRDRGEVAAVVEIGSGMFGAASQARSELA
jgi:hypothetical protein